MAQSDLTRIASNIAGLNALNALKDINTKLGIHQLRLSTGKRINQAADDPAGLTIGIKFNARARGLGVAIDNIGDAKNLLSVGEGGLSKINDILLNIREKVAQAASDSLGADERAAIGSQIKSLLSEVDTIAEQTTWNKRQLLTGLIKDANALVFQTGSEAGETTKFSLGTDHRAEGLGVNVSGDVTSTDINFTSAVWTKGTTITDVTQMLPAGGYNITVTADAVPSYTVTMTTSSGGALPTGVSAAVDGTGKIVTITTSDDLGASLVINLANAPAASSSLTTAINVVDVKEVSSATNAEAYLRKVDAAIKTMSESMTSIGALVSRLTAKEEALTISKTNTEAAYNRIMNADMAAEQLEAMKLSILQQTATAMLAQANTSPQAVLSLFR